MASLTLLAVGPRVVFPPAVAIHMVHLACECPARLDRRLSQWDCAELARPLVADGLVAEIDAAPMRQLWAAHQRKPWRHHLWLSPKHPWEAGFSATVPTLIEFYTRPRRDDAMVLSLDE